MKVSEVSPIALFTYNRPDDLLLTLDSLSKCYLAKESKLVIFQDFTFADVIDENKKIIKSFEANFDSVELNIRSKNLGCNKNMLDGITSVVEKYGKVIVMEDDLVVSPRFLTYLNDGLNLFKNSEVGCITAFNYQNTISDNYFFLNGTNPMGWATWRNKWDLYPRDLDLLISQLENNADYLKWDKGVSLEIVKKHRLSIKNGGKDTVWSASLFLNNQLTLWPKFSFVHHIGFNDRGTHSKSILLNRQMNDKQYPIDQLNNNYETADLIDLRVELNKRALENVQSIYRNFGTKREYVLKHKIKMIWLKILIKTILKELPYKYAKLLFEGKLNYHPLKDLFVVSGSDLYLRNKTSDLDVYHQIFIQKEYQKPLSILKSLGFFSKSSLILDIGANIGLSALYFKQELNGAQIYAFEPFETNLSRIPKEIESFQTGLWSKDTKLGINRNFRDGKEWSVQVVEDRNADINGKSLNTILTDLNIEVVDLLKVDIEGSEFEVFLNDKQMPENLKKVKAVVIEIHDECGDRSELVNFFESCKFKHEPLGELDLFFKN